MHSKNKHTMRKGVANNTHIIKNKIDLMKSFLQFWTKPNNQILFVILLYIAWNGKIIISCCRTFKGTTTCEHNTVNIRKVIKSRLHISIYEKHAHSLQENLLIFLETPFWHYLKLSTTENKRILCVVL
jgi:hypothetical protein